MMLEDQLRMPQKVLNNGVCCRVAVGSHDLTSKYQIYEKNNLYYRPVCCGRRSGCRSDNPG